MGSRPTLLFEISAGAKRGSIVAGVDEAGRGPWAGPVVAGAVILNHKRIPSGLNDSKKLSAIERELLHIEILQNARTGIGISTVEEIDEFNILEATKLAMQRAVSMLGSDITLVLIDGNRAPALNFPTKTIIGGDAKSLSIAAASIIAKVTRDKIMQELGGQHPEYGWHTNAGYGTKHHIDALAKYGITKHHRKSYKPIRELVIL